MHSFWKALCGIPDTPHQESSGGQNHQLSCIKIGILLARHSKINPELLLTLSGDGAASVETWLMEMGVEANRGDDIEQIYERLRASLET